MALTSFMQMEGEDFAAFAISALAGYAAGSLFPASEWAAYVSILVSYHLFLGWLVLNQSGAGLSMPIWLAAPTHAACMVVALGPVGFAQHASLGFGLFRYGIAALAFFEAGWLFSREDKKPLLSEIGEVPEPSTLRSTAEDEIAWIEYLSTRRPGQVRAGTSIREEREIWLRARMKKRMEAAPQAPVAETRKSPLYQVG